MSWFTRVVSTPYYFLFCETQKEMLFHVTKVMFSHACVQFNSAALTRTKFDDVDPKRHDSLGTYDERETVEERDG